MINIRGSSTDYTFVGAGKLSGWTLNADLARAFAALPEPGALGLMAIGGITLMGKQRRRRR